MNDIATQERDMLRLMQFKIYPDTLFFWLDMLMHLWDNYVFNFDEPDPVLLFKKFGVWEESGYYSHFVSNPKFEDYTHFRRVM